MFVAAFIVIIWWFVWLLLYDISRLVQWSLWTSLELHGIYFNL